MENVQEWNESLKRSESEEEGVGREEKLNVNKWTACGGGGRVQLGMLADDDDSPSSDEYLCASSHSPLFRTLVVVVAGFAQLRHTTYEWRIENFLMCGHSYPGQAGGGRGGLRC